MIEIEIDGRSLKADRSETIIQVADRAGIYIPRFCYHKKLSIAASCRMCLVAVEKAPKTLPACATPVMPGMKVFTRSKKARDSQKCVMEFLLINHPLDCPICDQGGECELQDLALGYGKGISRFQEGKRAVKDEHLGPLIAADMTRCIHCTRCVRFGEEIAGVRELGIMGRGEELNIATYVGGAVRSELSGNMIDVCPVGALTSRPYRFTARAWELNQHQSIAPHDCLGSNLYLHTRGASSDPDAKVMRAVPRENPTINEVWLSDRDRFSYEAIHSPERVQTPMIKQNGTWQAVNWEQALRHVAHQLSGILAQHGGHQIGALLSANTTTEAGYLLQLLMRKMGSHHIDHRLHQTDFRYQAGLLSPHLGMPIAALENLESVLLVGSDIRTEQPIAALRLRKAVAKGAKVMCINPIDYDFHFSMTQTCLVGTQDSIPTLSQLLKVLHQKHPQFQLPSALLPLLETVVPCDVTRSIAETLCTSQKGVILLGAYAIGHPDFSIIHALCTQIARLSEMKIGLLPPGANSRGLHVAGAVPHYSPAMPVDKMGKNVAQMFQEPLKAYLLLDTEPEYDSAQAGAACLSLEQAGCVIALNAFVSEKMYDYADVILPTTSFAETAGTYVNIAGQWQSQAATILPQAQAKPAWQLICDLARAMEIPEWGYQDIESVQLALKQARDKSPTWQPDPAPTAYQITTTKDASYRIGSWPRYRVDSTVRRAPALQKADNYVKMLRISPHMAERLGVGEGKRVCVKQGHAQIILPLSIDPKIADNCVLLPSGLPETAGFGEAYVYVQIHVI